MLSCVESNALNTCCFSNPCKGHDSKNISFRDCPIYRPQVDILDDISVLPIYRHWSKQLVLSAVVGVDKTLLYSSCIQTTCARNRYLGSNADRCAFISKKPRWPWYIRQLSELKQVHHQEVAQCLKITV